MCFFLCVWADAILIQIVCCQTNSPEGGEGKKPPPGYLGGGGGAIRPEGGQARGGEGAGQPHSQQTNKSAASLLLALADELLCPPHSQREIWEGTLIPLCDPLPTPASTPKAGGSGPWQRQMWPNQASRAHKSVNTGPLGEAHLPRRGPTWEHKPKSKLTASLYAAATKPTTWRMGMGGLGRKCGDGRGEKGRIMHT